MAQTNLSSQQLGSTHFSREIAGEVETSAVMIETVASFDASSLPPNGLYSVEVTLVGYSIAGFGLTGTLDVTVATTTDLVATGASGAFLTQLTPHLPVLVKFADDRTAVVEAVADANNATMKDAWTGADLVGTAATVHRRTYQTYTAVLQTTTATTSLDAIVTGGVVTVMSGAGTLTISMSGLVFSAQVTTASAEPTAWHATISVRGFLPQFT